MKKTLHFYFLLALLFSFSVKINAQQIDWLWAKSACALSAATNVTSITTDQSGNIFIGGNYRDSALFGSTVFHPVGTSNMFVAKYDSSGNFLWMLPGVGTNSPPYNLVTDLTTDSSGNCYFTGFFNGNIIMSHDTITSAGSSPDVFVGKISSSGTVIWLQQGLGSGSDYSYGIGLDMNGNCYIAGSFDQGINFGGILLSANNASNDIFITKLDNNGNFLSAKSTGGTSTDLVNSLAVDKNGNCFLTGTFTSPELIFGIDTLHYASTGADAYFARFDSSGNALWGRAGSGPGIQEPSSIAIDPNGNTYVTGVFKGDTMFIGPYTLVTYGYWDFFTAKFDTSGTVSWADHQGSSAFGPESSSGIVADSAGNYFTTGLFRDPASFDTITVTSPGNSDIFVTKFSSADSALWVEQSGSASGGLTSTAIHMDERGNIFIVGSYETSTIIGNDSLVVQPGYTAGYYFAKIGTVDTATTTSVTFLSQVKEELIVYPVPASDKLYFTFSQNTSAVSVCDMMGNTILEQTQPGLNVINISSLAPGIYMLETIKDGALMRKKFIKQ
jgi:hypothetical protein